MEGKINNIEDAKPLVSIGMPVYNGKEHIRQALDSLLAQDYGNFELIISDNASNDGTSEICLEYSAKEIRIRYYRHQRNIGAYKNFRSLFNFVRGKYFMLAAHDDWWDKSFISKCLRELEKDQTAVLCYPFFKRISIEDGSMLTIDPRMPQKGLNRYQRFHQSILKQNTARAIYGLIRTDALKKTNMGTPNLGADRALLDQLAILGHFVNVPEVLVHYSWERKTAYEYAESMGITNSKNKYYPKISECIANIKGVIHIDIPFFQKFILILDTLYCYNARYGNQIKRELRSFF